MPQCQDTQEEDTLADNPLADTLVSSRVVTRDSNREATPVASRQEVIPAVSPEEAIQALLLPVPVLQLEDTPEDSHRYERANLGWSKVGDIVNYSKGALQTCMSYTNLQN